MQDGADEPGDVLMRQTVPLEQGNRVQGQSGIGLVYLQMPGAGQHASVDRIPVGTGFQQLAVVQIGDVELALLALGMGHTAECGGGLAVQCQRLQEVLFRQCGALSPERPVPQVTVLLGLLRLAVNRVRACSR